MFDKLMKVAGIFSEALRDAFTFLRFNAYSPWVDKSKRSFYKIIIEAHTIEKGLSLQDPKQLFGKDKIRFVMNALSRYDVSHSTLPAHMALGALEAYVNFHTAAGVTDPLLDEINCFLREWEGKVPRPWKGGIKDYAFESSLPPDLQHLMASRSSIRTLKPAPLRPEAVFEAITMAQLAPSQCNRQSSRVHLYQDPKRIQQLLALQGGSRGFAESVGNLFVVSSEVCAWGGPGQRNQAYVDGALFAMCLMFACRSMGWGTCPLNLAVDHKTEKAIRHAGGIPEGERLIMMIAFGEPVSQQTKVAFSPRRPVAEIATLHA
ncbi:MAG: nitroreductase family protein [Hydrogenophaga sp.]|uniref:nitroreductase family protein n=1 Tax=Hydrogenophaga sp. TaxID=1904254 RepID=UPI002727D1F7|nr:nitroreductase family protein [Hydrogenophaga sp.]MDO9030790.1 nitroreductase family protein [Hydrogenophaga sp.]